MRTGKRPGSLSDAVTTYTKRDIRAADLLAIVLTGLGLVLVVLAVVATVGKSGKGSGGAIDTWILAGVFLVLGLALNLKVRQLVRNKGVEPIDYDGVPD